MSTKEDDPSGGGGSAQPKGWSGHLGTLGRDSDKAPVLATALDGWGDVTPAFHTPTWMRPLTCLKWGGILPASVNAAAKQGYCRPHAGCFESAAILLQTLEMAGGLAGCAERLTTDYEEAADLISSAPVERHSDTGRSHPIPA